MVSDDHIWTFAWDTPVSAKTITFTKWHLRPNYNACITHPDIILEGLIFGDKVDWRILTVFLKVSPIIQFLIYGVLANTGNFNS